MTPAIPVRFAPAIIVSLAEARIVGNNHRHLEPHRPDVRACHDLLCQLHGTAPFHLLVNPQYAQRKPPELFARLYVALLRTSISSASVTPYLTASIWNSSPHLGQMTKILSAAASWTMEFANNSAAASTSSCVTDASAIVATPALAIILDASIVV